jgi:signal transduction histidine kinase
MFRVGKARAAFSGPESAMAKQRPDDRTRLILGLELAVVLPAAALVILSALHLMSIQRDRGVEAAIQRDFTQVLQVSEKQFNQRAYDLMDDVRADFPAPGEACAINLDHVLAAHSYVGHVFVYDPGAGLIVRSQPASLKDAGFRDEAADFNHMMDNWMKMQFKETVDEISSMHVQRKGLPYYFFHNSAPRGEKRLYQSVALFLIQDDSGHTQGIGGIAFDADYLRQQFFPEMLDTVMSRNLTEGHTEKNPAVMMVRVKSEYTPLAAAPGWDGGAPEMERNLEGAFPGLTLAIKLRGTTLAALGQRFVRINFLVLGGLTLLLAGGIVLTHRNVAREMSLARVKSDFVSNVSHELRTPLSLIRLYAETLELGRLSSPEKYQEYYHIIRKESERLSALINNILDFSRIEAGGKEYDFRETDMGELVHATLDSYRYQIEQNGFVFEEKISENVPSLCVDREAVSRSLLNLVNNALKYSQDRKYIAVNLYRSNGSVKLEVIDHGIGVPSEEQDKIFEKFYRVGDPLVHNTKGSGLGLSLVRHIVHAHGGEVSVNSTPGQGSTFTISLPVGAGSGDSKTASRAAQESAG